MSWFLAAILALRGITRPLEPPARVMRGRGRRGGGGITGGECGEARRGGERSAGIKIR